MLVFTRLFCLATNILSLNGLVTPNITDRGKKKEHNNLTNIFLRYYKKALFSFWMNLSPPPPRLRTISGSITNWFPPAFFKGNCSVQLKEVHFARGPTVVAGTSPPGRLWGLGAGAWKLLAVCCRPRLSCAFTFLFFFGKLTRGNFRATISASSGRRKSLLPPQPNFQGSKFSSLKLPRDSSRLLNHKDI